MLGANHPCWHKSPALTPISMTFYPLTAPTTKPRAMNRSNTIDRTNKGATITSTSTEMFHHCGPRVAFCAAPNGQRWNTSLAR
jgi:hypothetical protein